MLIKFRVKHPKTFRFLKEGGNFLLIFIVVFVIIFTIFNGRAFYEQVKYNFRISIKKIEIEKLYNVHDSIIIPKISVNAPIFFPPSTDEKILSKELENGVILYPGSTNPGQTGNVIILGHSSAYPWYKGQYGSIFSLLNHLDFEDEIVIFYQKHKYIYKVISKKVINKNTTTIEHSEDSQLTLISCWPVGTTWKRILVEAVLTNNK